jgi:hypothetical protein
MIGRILMLSPLLVVDLLSRHLKEALREERSKIQKEKERIKI